MNVGPRIIVANAPAECLNRERKASRCVADEVGWHPSYASRAGLALILALVAVYTTPAFAQIDNQTLARIESLALDKIHLAMCDAETQARCRAATKAERANFPLPRDVSRSVVETAFRSAVAEACKLDFEGLTFFPMMREARASGSFTNRQIAILGLQHGIAMGMFENSGAAICSQDWQNHFRELEASQ